MNKLFAAAATITCAAVLAGCAAPPASSSMAVQGSPWSKAAAGEPDTGASVLHWQHYPLPGKRTTHFGYARKDGRDAVQVVADASASMLRTPVRVEPVQLGHLRFSWLVPGLIEHADMAMRDTDDAPVRIVLAFEGDRSRFSAKDAMLSELARAITGEEMPYATLMYVWCNKREGGELITSPRTSRIRKIVVESGAGRLNQWLDYERDIRADFERAFGEPPGALVGIALMSDTDNTGATARAWYGPVQLRPVSSRVP